ncbi:integrase [Virgibacillus profundi]|uniref:Integrase n=1 Tax=Virgibacillus profundi TaxID=2024555 RepID=A0A2A2IGE4_9BACI|nr:tyrosine-type recombinase/integrase [Virgibacillus profundi]PAV30163.1 integrase [Virgibacillus profundi]PXY54335.1 integrase [Virgibacillus profundi]
MGKVKRVKYFTQEKRDKINPENIKKYEKYLRSSIIKNREVANSTYLVYKNYMSHFLVYLCEEWDNIDLYSEEFMEDAVDIMEGFIAFCQEVLYNNKKVINTKLSTVSSFYLWSLKRGLVDKHPFDKQLDRMKGASDEKIISSHYLDEEQVMEITLALDEETKKYDIQDRLIWGIMIDSANRVGAISLLTLSSLDLDNMLFEDIREKRGYRVEVVFEEYTKAIIEEWLAMRKEMDDLQVDSLFITKYKGEYRPMTKGTIQARIKRIGNILGIDDFRSHSIRKTTLNNIYEATGDLSLAASMGNHKSVETTRSAYIKPQTKADVRAKIAELRKKKNEEQIKDK